MLCFFAKQLEVQILCSRSELYDATKAGVQVMSSPAGVSAGQLRTPLPSPPKF